MTIRPKNSCWFLLLIMAAVIGITAMDVAAADWMIQVADPTHVFSANSDHALAMGSDGTLYVAYGDKNLYLAKKMPDSADWVVEIVDSSSQVGDYASLALDVNNNPHISYRDRGNNDLKYARYDGSIWHIETADSRAGYLANGTSIVLDSNNRPHIVYFESGNDRLYYAHFDGTSWQYETIGNLYPAWESYLRPSIALDSNDLPHVVSCQYSSSSNHHLKHYYIGESGWTNETILSGAGFYPSIAIDTDDHIHLSYRGTGGSHNAGLGYGYYDGSTWQTANITAGAERAADTAIAVDGTDMPHIAYFDSNTGGGLKHAHHDGSIWQFSSVCPDLGAGTSIVVASANEIHISSIINNELRYSSDDGGAWSTITLDYSGTSGKATSIAVDSADRPHISHFSPVSKKLRYTHNNGSGFVSEIVDPADLPTMEWGTALALDSLDRPHIAYYNLESGTNLLKYARHDGMGWNLEDVGDGYYYMSVAVDGNDRPHICYLGVASLNYAVYNGATWDTETLTSGIYTPHCPSIALDSNDRPHIVYLDRVSVEFRYGHHNGTDWVFETLSTASSISTLFKTASIAVDSQDLPHVCWTDGTHVNYAHHDGTQWNTQASIDTGADYMDMALDSADYPHISYFNANGSDLKYAVYDGATWQMETVDDIGTVGMYTSIAVDSRDKPHISYYDDTNDELKYATPLADVCLCDLNASGLCDMQDWPLLSSDWGRENCMGCDCDLDGDGDCDGADLPWFATDWVRPDCR